MRRPREGEVLWIRVPGGRASHAMTQASYPRTVCGLMPEFWREATRNPLYIFERRWQPHRECARIAPRGRINFWEPDY